MDWIQFGHTERVIWMLAVLAMVAFFIWKMISQREHLGAFLDRTMQARLVTRPTMGSRIMQLICLALSGTLFVVALMQPQIVQEERVVASKDAANIFVALDVSKSMLSTDVAPDRLERAKSEIRDMLPKFSTHRIGLLAFAGRTTVLSPLTMDHGFFRLVLDNASPQSVTLGGTNLEAVIRKATKLLREQEGPKVLLLITDGEDHDSYPLEAAEEARQAGIVIAAVGLGSATGTTIDYLDKKTGEKKRVQDSSGKDVISKLDEKMLKDIVEKTNGVYVPAQNSVDWDSVMTTHILPMVDGAEQVRVQEIRVDLFQWFVGFALLFFLGFMLLEGRGFSRQTKEKAA